MNNKLVKSALGMSRAIQEDVNKLWHPPADSMPSYKEMVLPLSVFKGTRGYIEIVVNQINGTYEKACYDACAVMIRRLIETLIIEAFEQNNIAENIKNQNGELLPLSELIGCVLKETTWNVSRNTSKALKALPDLKGIGDLSAHNRRFNAHRGDIDRIVSDIRTITQELLYIAKLK
jgi:hypothetical protein